MNLGKSQKITLIVGFLIVGITYFVSTVIKDNIDKNAEFTIAHVFDYMNGPSSGPAIFYKYKVKGKTFENSDFADSDYNVKVGEFYRVTYSSQNPSLSELQQHFKILDTMAIKAAGFSLPKKKRNQFLEN